MGRGGDTGEEQKQTNAGRNTTCSPTKELDVQGRERLLSQPGSLDLTSCILPGVDGGDIRAGCSGLMYAGKGKAGGEKKRCRIDFPPPSARYEKVTLINAA